LIIILINYPVKILFQIIVISSIISYSPLSYTTADGTYEYPFYANVLGWGVALASMMLIPGYAVYKIIRTKGTLKEVGGGGGGGGRGERGG
jgi:hypothetical protein